MLLKSELNSDLDSGKVPTVSKLCLKLLNKILITLFPGFSLKNLPSVKMLQMFQNHSALILKTVLKNGCLPLDTSKAVMLKSLMNPPQLKLKLVKSKEKKNKKSLTLENNVLKKSLKLKKKKKDKKKNNQMLNPNSNLLLMPLREKVPQKLKKEEI